MQKLTIGNFKFMKRNIIIFVSYLLLLASCKKHNPDNFTLITFGYGGIYNGLEADPAKSSASQIVAARWDIDFYWRGCEYDSDNQ